MSESEYEMYSESESDELVDALNNIIQQLEEKVKYYKSKANDRFMNNMKLFIEIEQLKKRNENLKALLLSKFPGYISAVIECL